MAGRLHSRDDLRGFGGCSQAVGSLRNLLAVRCGGREAPSSVERVRSQIWAKVPRCMTATPEETCASCLGSGEAPTDYGVVDCPDCGGAGVLPPRAVRVEWRARDIERAVQAGQPVPGEHIQWLLTELRMARRALTEVVALAHDSDDPNGIGSKIRFTANRALGLYRSTPVEPRSER